MYNGNMTNSFRNLWPKGVAKSFRHNKYMKSLAAMVQSYQRIFRRITGHFGTFPT